MIFGNKSLEISERFLSVGHYTIVFSTFSNSVAPVARAELRIATMVSLINAGGLIKYSFQNNINRPKRSMVVTQVRRVVRRA